MGIETMILIGAGLGALKGIAGVSAAEKQAKMVTRQAEMKSKNKALKTMVRAGRQKVSFLGSGLTLEGTPMSVLTSTYDTGRADAQQIVSNANVRSRNMMSQARTQMVMDIASGASAGFTAGGGMPAMQSQYPGLFGGGTSAGGGFVAGGQSTMGSAGPMTLWGD